MIWTTILGQIVAGWLLADLIGGFAHWFEDRIASPHWRYIGPLIVLPNRDHHARPQAFTAHGLVFRNSTTWAIVLAIGAASVALAGLSLILIVAIVGGLLTSQVHYWAHVPSRAPRWIRALQTAGIIQSPAGHARHHRPPSQAHYCVLTDLLNPLLDLIGFWARLERALALVGVRAGDDDASTSSTKDAR